MKKFMKFIPVALGLLALASCSNDDFFGESQKQDFRATLGEGDMVVTMPKMNLDGNALTRGLRDFVPGAAEITYYFTEKDEIRVYDDALTKYNIYEYRHKDATDDDGEPIYAFRMKNSHSNINGEPVYALYPREDIIRGHWDYVESQDPEHHGDDNHTQGWIDVNIADYMTYFADYSRDYDPENNDPLYQDRLPMWGKIIADGGYVESKMEYLTGILCYQLYDASKRYKCLKIQVQDPKTKEFLPIAGKFKAVLEDNNNIRIAYEADGKTVIEKETARISYLDLVDEEDSNTEIVVDLTGKVGLGADAAKHIKVFVPLVCTDYDAEGNEINKKVDIIVSGSTDEDCKKYTELWRKNKVIKRGGYTFNAEEYNAAVDGKDICAINDVLAQLAESATEGSTLNLVAKNPIEINAKCNVLYVPNKNIKITIDFQNGVYASKDKQTLTLVYEDTDSEVTPPAVELIGKLPDATKIKNAKQFDMDVQLDKSAFGFVNMTSGVLSLIGGKVPLNGLKVDATSFTFGDSEIELEEGQTINSVLMGDNMFLSDNVQALNVDENAVIAYISSPYGLIIPATKAKVPDAPEGYTNKGIAAININGYFIGDIDAHAKAAKNVNLTVSTSDPENYEESNYAFAMGDFRVKGKVDVLGRALMVAMDRDGLSMPRPDGPSNTGGVVAAYDGVKVTGQSFISGPVFTKDKNIDINNVGLNMFDLAYNNNSGGKLSDLIYELFNQDQLANITAALSGILSMDDILEESPVGYGPLYAENGKVIVTSNKSKLIINDQVNSEVAQFLNQHAAEAVKFTVYASNDIDLFTENDGIIQAAGNMWAENDVNLRGAVRVENLKENTNAKIYADNDYAMEGPSFAEEVEVGHNATVSVDPQEGKCEAIYTLTFVPKSKEGTNALFLNEGYIASIKNETKVNLNHGTKPAFAAIGTVQNPDLLVPQNKSIWNGEQIPANYAKYYVMDNQRNIWTASQLAYQLNKITTVTPIIRSHIDLNNFEWPGIKNNASYNIQGSTVMGDKEKDAQKQITNINLTGKGFIVGELKDGLTVKNLSFAGKSTIPAQANLQNVGMVASEVGGPINFEKVKIILNGKFGSDGVNNRKAEHIGGAIGLANGPANFKGIVVDGSKATLCGYAGIGGILGKSLNDVTIANSEAYDTYGAYQNEVKGLKINVTYQDINQMKEYDEKQGMTGLYIGTIAFTKTVTTEGQDQQVTSTQGTEISIATGANTALTQFTVEGADDNLAVKYGKVKLDGNWWTGTYSFIRRSGEKHDGEIATQSLIGQSGIDPIAQKKPVYINGQPYYVKQFMQSTPYLSGILYAVLFKGTPQ